MIVKLIAHTPEPEKIIAAAAKLCYSNTSVDNLLDGLTPEKTTAFIRRLESMGHESPIEHASFTFAIEGVSRSLLAQITRHRIASFSVQSQRYVRLEGFDFVVPAEIEGNETADGVMLEAMKVANQYYEQLVRILESRLTKRFEAEGMSHDEAVKKASKMANEDARAVLPNACTTKMIVTMNARSLRNFFQHRCCNRAQREIRELAEEMLRQVKEVAPTLFSHDGPPCLHGPCPEGKMSCGQRAEMRAKYLGE